LNIDNIETKNNHESSAEDDGEVDEDNVESSDLDEEMIIQRGSRGKDHLAHLKTAKS